MMWPGFGKPISIEEMIDRAKLTKKEREEFEHDLAAIRKLRDFNHDSTSDDATDERL